MAIPRSLHQELRLALVINGGVSLAVWMGGVVKEIDRFRCAPHVDGDAVSSYRQLLDALRTELVADVIAGTSAGGINGALLGFAVGNGIPLSAIDDQQVPGDDAVRNTWVELGDIERLLDWRSKPTSVLRGEEVLFAGIQQLFHKLADAAGIEENQLDESATRRARLTITATGVHGYPIQVDQLSATDHRLLLSFHHHDHSGEAFALVRPRARGGVGSAHLVDQLSASVVGAIADPAITTWPPVDMANEDDLADDLAFARLARAARTSASFPIAFSASRVPRNAPVDHADIRHDVREPSLVPTPPLEPVLTTPTGVPIPPSGSLWAIDGGVWDNSPFGPVLDAIDRSTSSRDVRRVLAYVVGTAEPAPPTTETVPPGLVSGFVSAFGLPADLSLANDVARVRDHERRRSLRLASVESLLSEDADRVFALAAALLPIYRKRRLHDGLARLCAARNLPPTVAPPGLQPVWLPPSDVLPGADAPLRDWWATPATWQWGIEPVLETVQSARRLLRVVLRDLSTLAVYDPTAISVAEDLVAVRAVYGDLVAALREIADAVERRRAAAPASDPFELLDAGVVGFPVAEACAYALRAFASATHAAGATLSTWLARRPPKEPTTAIRLALGLVTGGPDAIVRRALAIEVVLRGLGSDPGTSTDYDAITIRPTDRWVMATDDSTRGGARPPLAGSKLHHFGGFLRRSWRCHDWLWGRLDGVGRIVELLLDQDQLIRLVGTSASGPQVTALARNLASVAIPDEYAEARACAREGYAAYNWDPMAEDGPTGPDATDPPDGTKPDLIAAWRHKLEAGIQADIQDITADTSQTPAAIVRLRTLIQLPFQRAIVRSEMPEILRQDAVDWHASRRDAGAAWHAHELHGWEEDRDLGLRRLSPESLGNPLLDDETRDLLGRAVTRFGEATGNWKVKTIGRLIHYRHGFLH